jgi:hypothetical protein
MSRQVPQIILDLLEDWARDSIRKRPDKGWTGLEIITKIKGLKERHGWAEFMREQTRERRKKETKGRSKGDPTPKQILQMAQKLREARLVPDDEITRKLPAIREYRETSEGEFERVT